MNMARLFLSALVLVMVTFAQGAPPKPKKVKCKDKKFPLCFNKELSCPDTCPRACFVNCSSCQPVCTPPPPPPPPPPPKPHKVKCKDKSYKKTCNKDLYCPASCPKTCIVDCATCQPICSSPPPTPTYTPPPVVTPIPPPPPPPPPPVASPNPPPPPVATPSPPPAVTPIPPPPPPPPPPVASPNPPPPPAVTPIPPPPPPPVASPNPPPPPEATPSPPPDSSEAAGGKRVRCKNKSYPSCYYREHRCPTACPDQCEVDCVTCSPVCDCNRPGAVCQDPRFIGADGITFYFHGKKDGNFCIVSDNNLHINAHFIGRRNQNMGRDFTWVQSLGILFDNHQISVGAKKTATWDNDVDRLELSFNGLPVHLNELEGAKWQPDSALGITITRARDVNSVMVEVEGNFKIKATVVPITEKDSRIHNYGINGEDCFAHLDLGFKFYALSGDVGGVLGQTYASNYVSRVKMGVDMPVLGGEIEFASSSLFSTDCGAARFDGTRSSSSANNFQYAKLNCASGLDGRGVVCRR